jgi:PAS domain S-box-containing protein
MFDEAGALTHAVAVFVDISERRKVERELAERTALVDLSGDAIYLRHPDGTILYWNHGAELKYGWSAAEATGKNAFELLHTELPMPREEIIQHLAAEGHWHGHAKQRTRTGEHIDVVVQWVAQKDRAGEINKVMVINTDVTDLRRAHDELARQASELTALNREYQRSNDDLMQFAYAASHDLAEPLRAIAGPISLLARRYQGQLDAEADTLIRFAVEGCDRMQKLISDLLTFSRVGRVDTVMGDVDMADIVKQLLSDLGAQINETGAKVEADPLPTVHGSAVELRQVLQNMVSNALKFHPCDHAPHVMITATRLTDAWRFSVSDDGIGIAPEYREQVFGMFKRLHSREDYAGTGIGLALVKKIVERHGGQVGVADGPGGVGSTFWFTIPDCLEVER